MIAAGSPRSPAKAGAIGGITVPATLAQAETLLDRFLALTGDVPHDGAGIPFSEMFFLFSVLASEPPRLILESGRGGGQSTLVLARCFPQARIVSVESDRESERSRAAVERLAHLPNVTCLFGDSRRLLVEMAEDDCAVLIDGPKEFRAVKLALQLLQTGKPRVVFIHDLHVDSPSRHFADRHLPDAFFSDEPAFVAKYSDLDRRAGAQIKAHWVRQSGRGYGPTLACVPPVADAHYQRLLNRLLLARTLSHVGDKVRAWLPSRRRGQAVL